MFKRKPNPAEIELNLEITRVLAHIKSLSPECDEYASATNALATLYAQKKEIPSNRFNKDAMLAVAGNLLGIGLIVAYEQKHVFTSQAKTQIGKFTR